jgi:hypothetical protein
MKFSRSLAALGLGASLAFGLTGCVFDDDDDDDGGTDSCVTTCEDAHEECSIDCDDDACITVCDDELDVCKTDCD